MHAADTYVCIPPPHGPPDTPRTPLPVSASRSTGSLVCSRLRNDAPLSCLIEHVESPQPFILGVHTDWLSDISPDALEEVMV